MNSVQLEADSAVASRKPRHMKMFIQPEMKPAPKQDSMNPAGPPPRPGYVALSLAKE